RAGDERIHPLRRRLRFRLERLHGKGGPAERLRVGLGEPARESARLASAAQDQDEAVLLHGLDEQLDARQRRSEEHTSELQSRFDLVCRLLLEKKKKKERII